MLASIAAALLAATPSAVPSKAPTGEFPLSCDPQVRPMVRAAQNSVINARPDDARVQLKTALKLDARCTVARVMLGNLTPFAEGKKMVEEAMKQATGLTEVEKVWLQMVSAARAGDQDKALALAMQARELAPEVTYLNVVVAGRAYALHRFDEAARAARRATELNPDQGPAWNMLGYANLGLKRWDDAVAAFGRYLAIAPDEPNAHDSLGDALLFSGKVKEAGAEYQKAVAGKMWLANTGLATVRVTLGDFAGARKALDAMRGKALETADKIDALHWKAATFAAQHKLPEALKQLDQAEKEARAADLSSLAAQSALLRGGLLAWAGRHAEALQQYAAVEPSMLEGASEGQQRSLTGLKLVGQLEAQAQRGQVAQAEASLKALEVLYAGVPAEVEGADRLAHGRGLLAEARGDGQAAVEALSRCSEQAALCRLALLEAQRKGGDVAGATATREALLAAHHRSIGSWLARARVLKLPAP